MTEDLAILDFVPGHVATINTGYNGGKWRYTILYKGDIKYDQGEADDFSTMYGLMVHDLFHDTEPDPDEAA